VEETKEMPPSKKILKVETKKCPMCEQTWGTFVVTPQNEEPLIGPVDLRCRTCYRYWVTNLDTYQRLTTFHWITQSGKIICDREDLIAYYDSLPECLRKNFWYTGSGSFETFRPYEMWMETEKKRRAYIIQTRKQALRAQIHPCYIHPKNHDLLLERIERMNNMTFHEIILGEVHTYFPIKQIEEEGHILELYNQDD